MRAIGTWFKGYLLQFIVLVIVLAAVYASYPRFHVESSIERIMPLGVVAAGLAVTMLPESLTSPLLPWQPSRAH